MNRLNPQTPQRPFYKKWWFWLIVFLIIIIIYCVQLGYIGSDIKKQSSSSIEETTVISEFDYKQSCKTIDYKTFARNPDKYKGNNYKFTGEVIQTQESSFSDTIELRINITKEISKYTNSVNWSDTIYAIVEIPDGEDRILDNDIITFWGTCDGLYSYTSVLGSKVSLPKINIRYYELATE